MLDLILFPSSYFNINKVDEDLEQEYNAAKELNISNVLFNYDNWLNGDKLKLSEIPSEPKKAIMRGWMLKPEKYIELYNLLLARNIELLTNPESYETMHIFPNTYKYIAEDTPLMRLYPLHKELLVDELKKYFDKFMVKDYVKSVKGTEFPTYFDTKDLTQEYLNEQMEVFYKYRGNLLTGGLCVKQYVGLKRYGEHTNEWRVFYLQGEIITISKNSNQTNYVPEPPKKLIEKYKNLPSPYYTIDFAELNTGDWTIIETGDGSVSGLSPNQDILAYYRAIYNRLNI